MKYLKIVISSLMLSLLLSVSNTYAQEINNCDIEAAHPSDPNHVGEGKLTPDVDTFAAIIACRDAVKKHPKTARFHYQLGRALAYQGEFLEGKEHIGHAANMNYMQAQFVLALLSKGEDICQAEILIKAAADQGLKSARITYVNDTLAGAYSSCKATTTQDDMQAYLKGAKEQMSGYYENMLLGLLTRELSNMTP